MISAVLMGTACVWLGRASETSYTSLLLARAFLGAFEAPIESIVPATITDIFFLHDRGAKVSLYSLSVLSGNELGPLLSALFIQRIGTQWAFYIIGILIHVNAFTILLAMPETKYTGPRPTTISYGTEEVVIVHQHDEARRDSLVCINGRIRKKSVWRDLAFWSEPDPHVSLYKAFLRPFILFTYPTVMWASVVYGMSLSWNVILASVVSQLFGPKYGFDSQAQGLVFLSPFVGSVVGTYLCGPLSDRIATYYTKRNNGIREPEMRLPTCVIAAVLVMIGCLITGVTYHYHSHWIGPVVGYGVLSAGAQMGATLSMSYALDCHKHVCPTPLDQLLSKKKNLIDNQSQLSVELMVTVAVVKSAVAWIWTWFISDWLTSDGALVVFMVIGGVNVLIYAVTIPLGRYGKEIRSWTSDVDMTGRSGSIIKRI